MAERKTGEPGAAERKPHALIVEDDESALESLSELVGRQGFSTSTATTLERARDLLSRRPPALLLLDLQLPDGNGLDLLDDVGEESDIEVVLVTAHATVETAVAAVRQGVTDYLTKPIDVTRLKAVLANVARARELRDEIGGLRDELRKLGRFGRIVGVSKPMQELYDLIAKAAPTRATVLLIGESGSGKEVVAHTIHDLSRRKKGAFLAVNCGAVAPTLIESQLFGHEKGSFTGAVRQHIGFFERADGGTLFLDEVTEMPMELQVKLLRVLETSAITRVGGTEPIEVNARVIAATNREPEEAVAEGKLRKDLFYRLKVFPIRLPPLRDRPGDVPLLVERFLAELASEHGVAKTVSPDALAALGRYHWPGNVRELRNALERAFIVAESTITAETLQSEILQPPSPAATTAAGTANRPVEPQGAGAAEPAASPAATGGDGAGVVHVRVGASIAEAEKRLILATLEQCDGNKKRAAGVLGISVRSLYNRLKAYREEGS